ncbi:MAG: branched-chain amino acid ABC transporter permease [Tepidisphaerales bacterium]
MAHAPSISTHVIRPRLPVWAINGSLTVLILALWPADRFLQRYMDPYYLRILNLVGINIVLASSLNLINGITGQFSLGHAGFMAVGAYVAGSAMAHYRLDGWNESFAFLALLIAAGLVAAVVGLVVGLPALRLRGDYLAIATLGFGEIIYTIINATEKIGTFDIGGASGLHNIPQTTNFFWIYAAVIVCIVAVWRLAYSTKGLAFRAVREDEIAAGAMGIDTTYHKAVAFAVGAFFAGVAGGLQACYDGNLAPESFRFIKSIEIVVMVVLGGSGSITGAIAAAIILTWLPEQLRPFKDWRMIVYSLGLILMMILRPAGLMGGREIWFPRRRVVAKKT